MDKQKKNSTCKHCGETITHYYERLWHSDSKVFPQYCKSDVPSDVMHEPINSIEAD